MSRLRRSAFVLIFSAGLTASLTAQTATGAGTRRPLRPDDIDQLRDVHTPQRSPDGKWVVYAVTTVDTAKDKNHTNLWMTSWDGAETVQLTSGEASESSPTFSPDGRFIAFLSSRGDSSETTQLWLMNRLGGEGAKATELTGDIEDYEWSPDGKRIVMVVESDPDKLTIDSTLKDTTAAKHGGKSKQPKPIVLDRYRFKEDVTGYLGKKRSHLVIFDVATRGTRQLTTGDYNELDPSWAPDGSRIAFVSKRLPDDPDRGDNWDVFVIDAQGGPPTRLTTSLGPDNPPNAGRIAWSPDGTRLAYVRSDPDPKLYAYEQDKLAVVPVQGGEPHEISRALDRGVGGPVWSKDGKTITAVVEDDRSEYPVSFDAASGQMTRLVPGQFVMSQLSVGSDGAITALVASDTTPPEVYAVEHGTMRRLSHQNDQWLAGIQLGSTEEFASRSADGTDVHGLLLKAPGWQSGRKYPTLLRIHGGPNGQDEHGFNFERQLLAANGYLVVSANYRGSAGRGAVYQRAIMADWGHKEVIDLLGAVDHVVAAGLADPTKLGIGGWSYGGILTDYTIATDRRFKAATSGAGSANQLSMYGVDEYITQYAAELGQPWEHPDLWMKVSYPFFHASKIATPTLFLGGESDFNVPVIGGEQMYQALKTLGVPAEMVVYPAQYHGLTRPSFKVDRLQRYVDWYARYLQGVPTTAGREGGALHP